MNEIIRCIREQAQLGKMIREAQRVEVSATKPAEALKAREGLNAATTALLECRKRHGGKAA